jgi:putative endonuclease
MSSDAGFVYRLIYQFSKLRRPVRLRYPAPFDSLRSRMVNHKLSITNDGSSSQKGRMSLSERSVSKTPPWFVYICESLSGYYYVGISTDPRRRIEAHNSGRGAKMAKDQGKFCILYISSPFPSKSEARRREIRIKGWSRNKKEKLISGDWE